jgi:hypothetical protein
MGTQDAYQNETIEDLRDVLFRNGFAKCNIAACNCGSWHARYGLIERWHEIQDALNDSDHPLSNENGHSTLKALQALIAERDALRAKVAELEKDAARWRRLNSMFGTLQWIQIADMRMLTSIVDNWPDAELAKEPPCPK